MVTLHFAIVEGLAELVRDVIKGAVPRERTMGTAFAGVGRYRVVAGLAHSHLAGCDSVLVADASDAVALFPLFAEFPRDALVNAVLRFLLGLHPGDRIWKGTKRIKRIKRELDKL